MNRYRLNILALAISLISCDAHDSTKSSSIVASPATANPTSWIHLNNHIEFGYKPQDYYAESIFYINKAKTYFRMKFPELDLQQYKHHGPWVRHKFKVSGQNVRQDKDVTAEDRNKVNISFHKKLPQNRKHWNYRGPRGIPHDCIEILLDKDGEFIKSQRYTIDIGACFE
jgi:hypothetical protein